MQRNWVFATNPNFLIPIYLQPNYVNLWYFKLWLFDITEVIVWNIYGLQYWVVKILGFKNQSLWQRLNSFSEQSVFMCYMIVWSYLITFNFEPCTDPTYLGDSKHIIYLENASANMEFKLKVLGKQISISYQSNIPPRHNFILYFLSKHSPRTVQYINHFKNRSFYRFQWLYVNF